MEQQQRAREDGIAYECGWQIFLTITPWTLRAASADMLEMYKMRSSLGIAINIEKDKSYQKGDAIEERAGAEGQECATSQRQCCVSTVCPHGPRMFPQASA